MKTRSLTRRQFVRDTMLSAAVVTTGLSSISVRTMLAADKDQDAVRKTRSYNPDMDYRRLGKTGLWVSAVCLGGHWKRIDKVIGAKGELNPYEAPTDAAILSPFEENRRQVVSRCIERGVNLIDLAGDSEAEVYARALRGRREQMYLAYSHPSSELRVPENRSAKKLLELLDAGLKRCQLDYVDIWRLMALERGGQHSQADVEAMITALDTARKQGKCRYTGLSTHDRKWAKMLIETYPDVVQVLVFPYTAGSKELPAESLFDAIRQYDVGTLGIKPFSSNAIFKGDGSIQHLEADHDNRLARLTLRYILNNPLITAPIPGLISSQQVDNVAQAIQEHRKGDLSLEEHSELQQATQTMWANLSPDYHWLRNWEYV
ncbi:MAG TPA: aldo/keto reductase [Verrucomicrobiota bacterium]|nr:aldo/keto reductase [Verrucomicrobiota bacterium]